MDIKEALNKMCPKGIPLVAVGDIINYLPGGALTRSEVKEVGKYPVMNGGILYSGFYDEYNYDENVLTISHWGSSASHVHRHYDKFWANNACWVFIPKDDNKCNLVYLYYILKCTEPEMMSKFCFGGATPNLNRSLFEKMLIPLPPLSIQQEIVKILDTFTTLIDKMKQELEKRKKQMEYYRELLLTFKDGECEWKTLGEVAIVSRGKRVVKKDLLESGSIPVYQNSLKPLGYADKSNYPAHTPFIISAGAAGEVGYSCIEYWGADDCFSILSEGMNSRFIYHWLKIKEPFLQSRIRGGAIKRLSRDIVDNLQIPVVSINLQSSIVSTLDKFESYITKLEKMIQLRQKQYEYYREQLLTFE